MSYNPSALPRSPVGGAAPSAPPADPDPSFGSYPPPAPGQLQAPLRVSMIQGGGAPVPMPPYDPRGAAHAPASPAAAGMYPTHAFPASPSAQPTFYAQAAPVPGSPSAAPFAQGPAPQLGFAQGQRSMHGGFEPVTPLTGPRMAPNMPMPNGGMGAPADPSSVVALRFRCKNLKTADVFSESDPFVVVYLEEGARQWREIGRTETVVNSANPTFTTAIEVDYFFEEVQRLRLEIFDRDSQSEKLNAHDFLGCVEFTMAQLMSTNGQSMVLGLLNSATRHVSGIKGHIVVDGEELSSCADQVTVQFAATKVDNKDGWFGKSDPFLNIYRLKDNIVDPKLASSWLHVWRSPHIMDNLNPVWPKVTLSVRSLCNGDLSRLLKFECMDWESDGRHQFIGSCTMTAGEFVSGEKNNLNLINAERQAKKGKKYVNSGLLRIVSLECFKLNTFAEYLRGGCEISLIVGIDFTASNGAFSDPTSLHYTGSAYYGQMNDYQSAISAAGAILEPYDHDKKFPVYGFGAMVNGAVNHCFPLTFDPSQPEVDGVQGILRAYGDSFPYISLHGPTYFAPLIRQASTIASVFSQPPTNGMQSLKYFVLLIITDGAIMDMDNTIEEIVSASYLPMSIVIVGVGNADFNAMDALDADGKLLRARSGRVAARDIVQFVPFNKFRSNPARLAKETLAEIPMQLTQHFRARGVKPNPPLQRAGTEMLIANATVAANPRGSPVGVTKSQV